MAADEHTTTTYPTAVDTFDLVADDSAPRTSDRAVLRKLASAVVAVETQIAAIEVGELPDAIITTRGDLLRGNSTGDAQRVALGATGAVLRSDGTDAVWSSGIASAYTQTYSTAVKTVPNATYAAPSVTAAAHTYPGSGNLFDAVAADLLINVRDDTTANAVADVVINEKSLADNLNQAIVDTAATNTQLAALAADVLELKKVITAVIDDLQAYGFVG